MILVLPASLAVILAVFTLLWARQTRTLNATAVDLVWALGVGTQTALLANFGDGDYLRRLVVTSLVGLWSVRLAAHLFGRVLAGEEDGRYRRLRRSWPQKKWLAFYLGQGLLVFLLPLTFLGALRNPAPFPTAGDVAALALWAFAWTGEAAADAQLARFRRDPANRGKTCRRGFWRYSRHPNYFFEWLTWIAYVPLAWGSGAAFGASLIGPALLYFFLTRVSGIPPTEEQALSSRADYRDYQRTTNAFAPWFPRRGA